MSAVPDFTQMRVGEINDWVNAQSLEKALDVCEKLQNDARKSVQKIADRISNRYAKQVKAEQHLEKMQAYERACRLEGFQNLCGMDEVGRGPLAGPVVTASVILKETSKILFVDDSKKLSAKKREALDLKIREDAIAIEIGLRTPAEIDAMNILNATKSAMEEAVSQLEPQPDLLLIDALNIHTDLPTKAIVHGDATCYSIAAASIVAKVFRDHLMLEYAKTYPEYGFEHNMGYGTQEHIDALIKYGPSPIHRKSFIKHFV